VPTLAEIFAEADRALASVPATQGRDQLFQMRRFMEAFERLGREVAKGSATWAAARPWALGACSTLTENGAIALDLYRLTIVSPVDIEAGASLIELQTRSNLCATGS
jgi:hypothetical protein